MDIREDQEYKSLHRINMTKKGSRPEDSKARKLFKSVIISYPHIQKYSIYLFLEQDISSNEQSEKKSNETAILDKTINDERFFL